MPLHPTIAAMLDAFRATGRPALSAGTPADARALMAGARAAYGEGPALPRVEDLDIPTRAGSVAGRLYVASESPDGLVVYLHGGGWVIGTIPDFDALARVLAARSGCAVLLVDYRLAPEAPFPAALEDTCDALVWASRNAERLVGRAVPLVIAGDSAGGNLAAVAAVELAGTVPLALQVLIYPVADRDFDTPSYRAFATGGILTRDDMIWFFDRYAPDVPRTDPRLAPLARADLAGVAPAHVVTAEYDVLRDEGEAYAAHLAAAGIPATMRRYDGLPHGFVRLHNLVDTVDAAVSDIADAIGRACRQPAPDARNATP